MLKSANASSLLSHVRTQVNTLRDPAPGPAQELNKSIGQIMEPLVEKKMLLILGIIILICAFFCICL